MTTDDWSENPTPSSNGHTSKSSLMEIGMAQTQGYRSNIEDFYGARDVQTKGGLTLLLAIVADGIGGNNHGEVAAEMTVKLVFEYVENSAEASPENIPQLLKEALEYANDKVFTRARTEKGMSGMGTTAAVAAVCEKQFYFANVGDSRIYLFRQGVDKATKEKRINLHPVTLDHTWGHEMIVQGKLEADKALTHPKAGELTRSIGYESTLDVDLSFYPNGLDTKAAIRKTQGLKLGRNDRIVICSDGLIKERHDDKSQVYTTEAEIIQALTTKKPQQAAEALIKQVDERKVDDNASVIVLEVPGSARVPVWQQYLPYIAGGLLALLLLGGGIGYAATRPDPTPTPTAVAVVEEPTAEIETAVADTSPEAEAIIPTQTPEAVLVEAIENDAFAAKVYGSNNSEVLSETLLQITQGDLVVEGTGTPVTIQNRFKANVQLSGDGLVGVRYDTGNKQFAVHCLKGTCVVRGDVSGEVQLPVGQAVTVGSNGMPGTPFAAQNELFTFAAVVPIPTEQPTDTPSPTPTATHTPRPTATHTPIPTSTPLPQPTSTPATGSGNPPPTTEPPTTEPPTAEPPTAEPPSPTPCIGTILNPCP